MLKTYIIECLLLLGTICISLQEETSLSQFKTKHYYSHFSDERTE